MSIQQKLQLALKHALTPSLQLAIRLLPLSRLELVATINQELTLNPVLEESAELELMKEDTQEIEFKQEKEKADPEQVIKESELEDFFFEYFDNVYIPHVKEQQERISMEATISQPVNLAAHLRWQLALAKLSETQKEISEVIIGNLMLNGLLSATVDEIAEQSGFTIEEVEEVLKIMQRLDPVGVAARNVKECLFLQLENLGLVSSPAAEIIDKYLNLVMKFDYKSIARKLNISIDQVKYYIEIIKNLDPSPGYRYNTAEPIYIKPDVEVIKVGDHYEIELLDEGLPKIRINPIYKKIIKEKNKFSQETISYVKEKLKAGLWLIKSLELRQQTLYKVAKAVVEFQKDFLDYGPSKIKPLTLKDVAAKIQLHESTISRAVTNKYMMTPQGLFEIKYFFHSGLGSEYGDNISSLVVKDKIRQVIEQEPSSKPYSDSKIVQLLKKQGIKISRRTIAKYRDELNIPASHIRKNIKKY